LCDLGSLPPWLSDGAGEVGVSPPLANLKFLEKKNKKIKFLKFFI
jgi:hypothetical protein